MIVISALIGIVFAIGLAGVPDNPNCPPPPYRDKDNEARIAEDEQALKTISAVAALLIPLKQKQQLRVVLMVERFLNIHAPESEDSK